MNTSTYPPRPSFFAHKVVRLLFRTCAAGEIGPNAVLLLVNIAHAEDAKRYTGPVRFYAVNLANQCGFSVSTMERARKKAEADGWLHYEPGVKRRQAMYWVTIPERFQPLQDGPTDDDVLRQIDGVFDGASDVKPGMRPQPDGALEEHVTHLLPSSSSQEESATDLPSPRSQEDSSKQSAEERKARTKPTGPFSQAVAVWCEAWERKYGKPYSFAGGKDGAMVKWMLAQLDSDVAKFRATVDHYLADRDPFLARNQHPLSTLRSQFNTHKPSNRPVVSKYISSSDLAPALYGLPAAEKGSTA